MAVLAGFGVIGIPDLMNGLRLSGAARTVATRMRLARGQALALGTAVEVRFDLPRRELDTRTDAASLEVQALPMGVDFAAVPARGRVRFGALGTAENATVTLGAGTRRRSVVVNQRGRVRVS